MEKYFYNPFKVDFSTINAYYKAAHYGRGNGKYLLASIKGLYINTDISKVLFNTKNNITLIFGEKLKDKEDISNSYTKINQNIKIKIVLNAKYLPQLESPENFCEEIF